MPRAGGWNTTFVLGIELMPHGYSARGRYGEYWAVRVEEQMLHAAGINRRCA